MKADIVCTDVSALWALVFHVESFQNKLLELDFSISKRHVSTIKPSQEDDFLHGYDIFLLRLLLLFIYQNTSETIRLCFRKKSDMGQRP